jgi:hypothetical protein
MFSFQSAIQEAHYAANLAAFIMAFNPAIPATVYQTFEKTIMSAPIISIQSTINATQYSTFLQTI